MASVTEISNLAISHLGIGKEIQNLETEQSAEASACRRYYDTARQSTIRDFDWSFARRRVSLALVESSPNEDWAYSYRYPTSALKLLKIASGVRNETRQSRVPYEVGYDGTARVIYTDQEQAELLYISDITDTSVFPVDFMLALSYRLAFFIAPRITGGDPFKLGEKSFELYSREIDRARATALNEEQVDYPIESELIRLRE